MQQSDVVIEKRNTIRTVSSIFKSKRNLGNYLFLAPGLLFLMFFMIFPIFYNLLLGFQNVTLMNLRGEHEFIGLSNYINIFLDPVFKISFVNSIIFTAMCIFFQFAIGFAFALLFNMNFPGKNFLRSLLLLAWMLPMIITSTLFRWMMSGDYGVFNYFLLVLGIIDEPILWLTETSTSLLGTIIANIWIGVPFNMIILLGGLQSLPDHLYEAAKIDGASRFQQFRHITLPLMRPTILILLMLGVIYTFKVFDLIYIMTGGGPVNSSYVLPFYAFNLAFVKFDFSMGAAVATLMFVFLCIVSAIYLWFLRKEEQIH